MGSSGQEFELGENPPKVEAARPVVVVHYRRSFLSRLAVPILLLVTAGALLSHRVKLDDWRGFTGLRADLGPDTPRAEPPRPITVLSLPQPNPIRQAVVSNRPPGSLPAPIASRPIPAVATSRLLPLPVEGAATAEALEAIRRESELAKAEAASMEALKAQAAVDLQKQRGGVQRMVAFANPVETDDDRLDFHDKLGRILKDSTARTVPAIEELCLARGTPLFAERAQAGTASTASLTSNARRDRVEGMRARGIAEAAIFGDLVRFESKNRAARSGPRSRQEVLVRAAKQLLALPPRSTLDGE